MRKALVQVLSELAGTDRRLILLTADLGYSVLEPFAEKFPDRFINVGVAEQNMVGMATGLAESGFIPFVYSITPFAALRPYEFIRNGPVLHKLPVRILGIGGGFDYEVSGPTHYALEDVGVMRIQPGLRVIVPADHEQTRTALRKTWDLPGPIYYRLGKDDKSVVPGLDGVFAVDQIQQVRQGNDLAILAMGSVGKDAVIAAEELAKKGISCSVGIVASINPPPSRALVNYLSSFKNIMTVEEHYISGGLGSLVSEVIADNGLDAKLHRSGVSRGVQGLCGKKPFLNDLCDLSAPALVRAAVHLLQTSRVFSEG